MDSIITDNKPVWLCLTICRRCTQKDINGLWSIVSGSPPVPGCDWALPLVPVINLGRGWPHTFHICVKITLMCSKRLRRVAQPSAWPQPAQLVRVGSGHECCHTHIQCFTHTLHTKPSAHTAPSSLMPAKYRSHSPWRISKGEKILHNFWHQFWALFTKGNNNWWVPEM